MDYQLERESRLIGGGGAYQQIRIIDSIACQAIDVGLMEQLSAEERWRIERETGQRDLMWRALVTSDGDGDLDASGFVASLNAMRQELSDTSKFGEFITRFETVMREHRNNPTRRMIELRRLAQQASEFGLLNPSLQSIKEWEQFGGPFLIALRAAEKEAQGR